MATVVLFIVFIGICASVSVLVIKKKKEAENNNAPHNTRPNNSISQEGRTKWFYHPPKICALTYCNNSIAK